MSSVPQPANNEPHRARRGPEPDELGEVVEVAGATRLRIVPLPADAPPDLFDSLTTLLHRAYRGQVEMGLRPLAGRQDAATTAKRCRSGQTYLAYADANATSRGLGTRASMPVGMILVQEVEEAAFPTWFLRRDVAHFSLLAVDPDLQRAGVGARLVAHAEERTAAAGFVELALSMAEPDTRLLGWYVRRGYRLVERWQWPYTNYRSLILSRRVGRAR